jgi:MFS family permease
MNRTLAIVLGITQTLVWATSYYMPAVGVGPAAASKGESTTALGGGFSLAMLIQGLASPRAGSWVDAHGGRGMLLLSSIVVAAGLLLMAAVPNIFGWYAGWVILGIGMAMGLYDAAFATVGRLLLGEARPTIVGITLIAGFASTVGWPLGTALIDVVGWRWMLVIYAGINIVINIPLVLVFIPKDIPPAPPPPARKETASRDGNGMVFVLFMLGVFFALRAGLSAIVSVHGIVLMQGVGLSLAAAVAVASMFGPFQVVGRILEWSFKRWMDPLASSWAGAVLMPLGVAAMLLGAPPLAFSMLYGMSNGILTISRGTLPLYIFGPHGYATRIGRLAMPQLLAQAVSPTLVTPLVESWPAATIFLWIGALSAVAMLCLAPLRRSHAHT